MFTKGFKGFWSWLALLALMAVSLLLLVAYLGTDTVVGNHPELRPLTVFPGHYRMRWQTVAFASTDRIPLRAWWLPAEQQPAKATVLLAHSSDENRAQMLPRASFLVRGGYSVLDIDLRAHGESGGDYQTPGVFEARDVLGGAAFVRNQIAYRGPIVAYGFSSGAVASIYAAATSPAIAAVIADSPFISGADFYDRVRTAALSNPDLDWDVWTAFEISRLPIVQRAVALMFYLRTGMYSPGLWEQSVLPEIPRLGQRPILFIAGENDTLAPPENIRKMYEAAQSARKQIWIVSGASHKTTYTAESDAYEARVLAFLRTVTEKP